MKLKTKPKTESEALFRDLNKPTLHALSYALRHPDTWPKGFIWNYNECQQCAMGLASILWSNLSAIARDDAGDGRIGVSIIAREMGIPFKDASNIFLGDGDWCPEKLEKAPGIIGFFKPPTVWADFSAVTPDMVADQIDKYLATAE